MKGNGEIEDCEARLLPSTGDAEEPRDQREGTIQITTAHSDRREASSSNLPGVPPSRHSSSQRQQSDPRLHKPRNMSPVSGRSSGLVSLSGILPESRSALPTGAAGGDRRSSLNRRAGRRNRQRQPLGIMDTIGREIAVIVAPVSVCMLIVVCLVLTLTPNGSPDGGIMPAVGSLVYQEKSTDTDMEKLEGGLLNALAFVGMVAVLTFVLVGLFWLRCTKCLWGYMGFSGFTILACLGGYVAVQLIKVLSVPLDVFSFLFLLYNVSVVGVLAVFFTRMPIFLTQCYLVLIASVVAFWFTHLPEWTTWLILVAMAVYDIVAVLAPGGPLKLLLEIAMEREEDLPALVYEARPPPHAPLTPPPEPSTSPPAVLVAGDRAGPVCHPTSQSRSQNQSLPVPAAPKVLTRSSSDSVVELATITAGLPQRSVPSSHAAHGDVPAAAAGCASGVASAVESDLEPLATSTDKPSQSTAEPRRLVGRFERRAPTSSGAPDAGSSFLKKNAGQGLISVVSEGSAMSLMDRDRQADLSVERLMQARRDRAGQSSTGPPSRSDLTSPTRALSERSQSFPLGTRRVESPGTRRPQLFLERLEVPVDAEGTAVVVSRQRSPVRRHVSRKPGAAFGAESSGSSQSSSQEQGTSELPPPQQTFHLFNDLRPQQRLPPGPVRVLPTVSADPSSGGDDLHQGLESVPEFVLPGAIKLGLGDFIFYSIMAGRAAMYDMMTVYACYLAIIAGLGATLVLLAVTRRALPALPFSICLGVLFYLLTRVLLEPFVVVLLTSLLYF